MSLESSIYAEYAEGVRKEWTTKLQAALEESGVSDAEKLEAVKKIVRSMNEFDFSE